MRLMNLLPLVKVPHGCPARSGCRRRWRGKCRSLFVEGFQVCLTVIWLVLRQNAWGHCSTKLHCHERRAHSERSILEQVNNPSRGKQTGISTHPIHLHFRHGIRQQKAFKKASRCRCRSRYIAIFLCTPKPSILSATSYLGASKQGLPQIPHRHGLTLRQAMTNWDLSWNCFQLSCCFVSQRKGTIACLRGWDHHGGTGSET